MAFIPWVKDTCRRHWVWDPHYKALWPGSNDTYAVNARDRTVTEGMKRKGQSGRYTEKIVKRAGCPTRYGGSGRLGGKGDSLCHWAITERGRAFNRK